MLMLMLMQATEVASAAKRAQAHETPGRGDMLPRFEVRSKGRAFFPVYLGLDIVRDVPGGRTTCSQGGGGMSSFALRGGGHHGQRRYAKR